MKVFSTILIVSILSVFLLTGNALAEPTFTGDPYADWGTGEKYPPDDNEGAGYYIWANDAERTSWSIRWSGQTSDPIYTWSGDIVFSDNHGITGYTLVSWDGGDYADDPIGAYPSAITDNGSTDTLTFGDNTAGPSWDGIDFTVAGNTGDTLTFNLYSSFFDSANEGVYIGDGMVSVIDDCDTTDGFRSEDGGDHYRHFKIGAPVPVPAAVWLLGSGLIGLIGIGRRRRS